MESDFTEEQLFLRLEELRIERENHENLPELKPHNCDGYKELRVRHFGGGKHYVYQCQVCGEQRGQSLKAEKALQLNSGKEPALFDESIEPERYRNRQKAFAASKTIYDEERQILALIHGWSLANFESTYKEEQQKLEKANSKLSELLEEFEAEFGEDKVLSSLISQTVKRKKKRYAERKERTDRFTSEKELKSWLLENLQEDFHIYSEVSGIHLAENVTARIDYIFYPKLHLVAKGFATEPFGVEVKYFKQEDGFTHKTSRGIWQTISYNDCQFDINGKKFKTKFCLLFSNLSFSAESALVKNLGYEWENDQIEWRGMVHVANHARVGTLSINGDKQSCSGWGIRFAGGTYFVRTASEEGSTYRLSNPDTINKVRIGNF